MKKVCLRIMLTIQWGHFYQFTSRWDELGKTGADCRYHFNVTIKKGSKGEMVACNQCWGKASLTYPVLWVKRFVEVSCEESPSSCGQ